MIKAAELRIGNAIWDDTRNKVKWVNHRVISDLASHATPLPYSPIPLTSEWLERCGFSYSAPFYAKRPLMLSKNTIRDGSGDYDGFILRVKIDDGMQHMVIRYLHQLQNLYFALTGEELTIKE